MTQKVIQNQIQKMTIRTWQPSKHTNGTYSRVQKSGWNNHCRCRWSSLKAAVSYSQHLGVALEITEDLPSDLTLYDLWRSEPVRAIVIPTRLFVSLPDGSPALSPFHVLVVQSFFLLWNVKVFLRPGGIISAANIEPLTPYTDYIRDLYHTSLVGKAEIPSACLFPPSQPLRDHLADSQYEEFELDKRKYADYEAAVDRYIRYRQSFEDVPETFVVAVVDVDMVR